MSAQANTDIADLIAAAVVAKIDIARLIHLGASITERDLDIPYPVTLICDQLGNRGRPIAYQTFQKRYIDTGRLKLITNPNDRRTRHVRLGDWLKLKKETGLR